MIHLSFDQDWAPDWATAQALEAAWRRGLHPTLFVTHASPGLAAWGRHPRLELGLHPNFLPGSTHGATPDQVLAHCLSLVPGARGVRTHGLLRGTALNESYARAGLAYDASDLLEGVEGLRALPAWPGGVVRLPIYWEDDVHLLHGRPMRWGARAGDVGPGGAGLRVFNLHPVLLALNVADLAPYRALKASLAARGVPLPQATSADLAPFRHAGPDGLAGVYEALLDHMAARPEDAGGPLAAAAAAAS